VGNFAAESSYFNDIVEDGALAKGWAGGTGFAQWTGARRRTFEVWIRKKGWAADSYEGNYSYLFRELKGYEPRSLTGLRADIIDVVKAAKTPEDAAWRVGKYFEKPKDLDQSIKRREKAAKEALELYQKNPVPPTAWGTDLKEVPVPVTPAPTPVVPGPVTTIPGTSEDRAIPWYDSTQLKVALTGIVTTFAALAGAYDPALSWARQNWAVLGPLVVAFLSALFAFIHRILADAQPVTGSQKAADKINKERTAEGVVQAVPLAPAVVPAYVPPEPPAPQPMTSLPADQIFRELPGLLEGLFKIAGVAVPQVAMVRELMEQGQKLADRSTLLTSRPEDRKP
jgi:hypothetical protein